MKNILLINSPVILNKNFIDYPYFINLGLLQNAACLKEKGYDVAIFDSFAQENSGLYWLNKDEFLLGTPSNTLIDFLKSNNFDIIIIGINSFLHPHRFNNYFKNLILKIKKTSKNSILIGADFYFGGMHYINYNPVNFLKSYSEINYLIKYETEKILPEILKKLPQQKIIYGNRKNIMLNDLPYPAWDLINIKNYFSFLKRVFLETRRGYIFNTQENILPIITTRGCVYNCVFCSTNPDEKDNSKSYRKYSYSYLKGYIKHLKSKYKIKGLIVLDGMVNLNKLHFNSLLNLLNKENIFYDFPNGLRADKIEKKQLAIMKDKIATLSISAESGVQSVVDKIIKKKQKLKNIEKVASWCAELNIPLLIHYVIGFPGETKEDINKTLNQAFIMNQRYKAKISVQFATPLEGTQLYNICKEKKYLQEEAKDYSLYFYKKPLIETNEFTKDELLKFKEFFDKKINAKVEKLIVNITYNCNNHCIFCAIGDREKVEINYEEVKELLLKYKNEDIKLLDLDGGEPTLHKNLFNIIKFAKEIGYEKINVTTNGRRLRYLNFAREFLNSGITDLLISLHGHNEYIQELNTGVKESFSQTINGIKNVLKLNSGKINVGVNFTITKYNFKYLKEVFNLLINLGIKKVNIQFVTPFGRAQKSVLPPLKKSINIIKNCLDNFKEKMQVNILNTPWCYFKGYENNVADDFYKHKRYMKFAGGDLVNLGEYLQEKRIKKKICFSCVYNIICDGFYEF